MNGGLVAIVAATAVNAIYAVRHGHTLYVVLAGGVVLSFFIAALDAVGTGTFGSAVAYTFLVGTLVYRGRDLIDVTNGIISSAPPTKPKGEHHA